MKKEKIDIKFSATLKALTRFTQRYNETCQCRRDRITSSAKGVADRMITLYLGQINGRLINLATDMIPGFHTFNPSLAKDRGCTQRTIINIRQRLVKGGVIKKELLNGNDGIYIWFADEIFQDNRLYTFMVERDLKLERGMKNLHASQNVHSLFLPPTRKNFHPLVSNHELINNNRDVDKWISPLEAEEKQENSAAGEKEKKAHPASTHSPPLLGMIERFWLRARIKLYPHEQFDPERTRHILNLIWESVYEKLLTDRTNKEWEEFHKIALRRIGMVYRWLHRRPNHWIPIPEIYFDPLNDKNGFNNTWEWYLRSSRKK